MLWRYSGFPVQLLTLMLAGVQHWHVSNCCAFEFTACSFTTYTNKWAFYRKCAVEINVYVCLQPLNWRHTICHLPFSKTQTTWDWVTWQELEGRNNFRFQRNKSNFSPVPFQLQINELERRQRRWKHFKLHMSECVCLSVCVRKGEWEEQKQIYRQDGRSHKGPADSPESVWLETNHHFNVLAKPLQTCSEKREEKLNKRREMEES